LLQGIVEKPVYDNLISAGMYVLAPEALRYIPRNSVTDMPAVLLSLVQDRRKVAVFSMQDEWVDIGRHDDLDRAKRHFVSGTGG
jgi:NDP-sugar pyrophosphorylase family protein